MNLESDLEERMKVANCFARSLSVLLFCEIWLAKIEYTLSDTEEPIYLKDSNGGLIENLMTLLVHALMRI